MKLYPKKLHNVDELKREKKLLAAERRKADLGDLFSIGKNDEKSSSSDRKETDDDLMKLALSLLGTESIFGTAMKFVPSLLGRFTKSKKKKKEEAGPDEDKPSFLVSAAKEVIFGYVKWKAIELSYKGIKKLMQSRKKNES